MSTIEKMKTHSKITTSKNTKLETTPLNVSPRQGDYKPNNDVRNESHIGGQVGMPEEKKITFKEFRKKSQNIQYGI